MREEDALVDLEAVLVALLHGRFGRDLRRASGEARNGLPLPQHQLLEPEEARARAVSCVVDGFGMCARQEALARGASGTEQDAAAAASASAFARGFRGRRGSSSRHAAPKRRECGGSRRHIRRCTSGRPRCQAAIDGIAARPAAREAIESRLRKQACSRATCLILRPEIADALRLALRALDRARRHRPHLRRHADMRLDQMLRPPRQRSCSFDPARQRLEARRLDVHLELVETPRPRLTSST